MDDPTSTGLLDLLEEHEQALSSLYATLSAHLPEMKELWDRLAYDEEAHAAVLAGLRARLITNGVFLNARKLNASAVRTSIAYIRSQTDRVAAEGTTPIRALSLGLSLERAIIEKDFLCTYTSDLPDVRQHFREMLEHTVLHRKVLEEHLEAEKRKTNA